MMPLEYFPLIPAGVRVSEVRAAARSQTSLGQRQLSVLSEFLLSAKIVRNGASSIRLARRSARSGLSLVSRPHSVESPPETKFSSHATWKGWKKVSDIERILKDRVYNENSLLKHRKGSFKKGYEFLENSVYNHFQQRRTHTKILI